MVEAGCLGEDIPLSKVQAGRIHVMSHAMVEWRAIMGLWVGDILFREFVWEIAP
jgi:hypothetical protein